MQHDDWTKQLRDRLADRQATPPDDLWQGIERALQAKRRRKRVVMLRWCTAAAAIAAVVAVGVGLYVDANREQQHLTARSSAAPASYIGAGTAAKSSLEQEAMTLAQSAKTCVEKIVGMAGVASADNMLLAQATMENDTEGRLAVSPSNDISTNQAATAADNAENKASQQPESTKNTTEQSDKHNDNTRRQRSYAQPQQYSASASRGSTAQGQWTVGAHAANVFGQRSTTNGVMMSQPVLASMASTNNMYAASAAPMTDTHEEKKHYQPVTVGLTASYAINDRVSLTSGVTYTRAASDFVHVCGNASTTDQQTLHYVGVPVAVNYNVWRTGKLKVYASASGQADFNVKASVETEGVKANITKDRPQLSVGAAAGAQYDVAKQVGVYVEPGVKYYFDNHSDVENVFKSRPCSFSLQVGVRLNIK